MRLIDAEKFEVFNATCPIPKGIRSGKTAAYFYVEGCRKVLEAIDAAPTIDPETLRPTAHWTSVKDRLPDPYEKVLVRLDHWAWTLIWHFTTRNVVGVITVAISMMGQIMTENLSPTKLQE